MTKPSLLLLLLLVVCVSVFRANISRVLTDLAGTHRVALIHNSSGKSYSALQPYSYIVVDPNPYAAWARIDFDHPWLTPNALTNTALTYALDPPLSPLISAEWEAEPMIDRTLASISLDDDYFVFSGDNFAAHPHSLFAENQGNRSDGDWSNSFFASSNISGGPAGYRRISTSFDPISTEAASPIPEPSTAALFAGLGAILVYLGCLRASSSAAQVE